MRVVLADLRSDRGFVNKDTAVGGYGQRMTGFCAIARLGVFLRRRFQDPPSVTLGYLAAILARAGHEVAFTRSEVPEGDVALVSGDFLHHPVQCAEPGWAEIGDDDADEARAARRRMLNRAAERGALFLGTHFPTHPAGRIRVSGDCWRFEPQQ